MDHLISSFYPRGFARRSVTIEDRFGDEVAEDLRRRGHEVEVSGSWTLGRVTAVAREPDGLLKAGANPRGMQGYAAGR
jgi:gamma-glutamyltranspeptidase / glutathione hydrolase